MQLPVSFSSCLGSNADACSPVSCTSLSLYDGCAIRISGPRSPLLFYFLAFFEREVPPFSILLDLQLQSSHLNRLLYQCVLALLICT